MNENLNVKDLETAAGGMGKGMLKEYVTKSGDTLWGLSQTFGIDVNELFRINYRVIQEWYKKMNPGKPIPADDQLINYLYVGMTLMVPA
jgi:LysM repeat protein